VAPEGTIHWPPNPRILTTLGRAVESETIHDEDGIVIEVAFEEAMLVMKSDHNALTGTVHQ